MSLTYGEMFAGYGGLGMGVQSVLGGEMTWCAEFEAAPSKILAHHWPNVPNLGDVTKVDWSQVEPVDVITGGSPCQDLSHAGKRAGMKAGTRSGLWASMCDAIDIIRPRLVVWENVRGALSAEADSAMEQCPRCVGDPRDRGPVLRALGRVLGDLSELGYDSWWYGLRAADVGAAHGRFRIFVFATPADALGSGWARWASDALRGSVGRTAAPGGGEVPDSVRLLPSPRTSDANGAGAHGTGGPDLRTAATLLPTPTTEPLTGNGHARNLGAEARLLPTPRATRGGSGTETRDLLVPTPLNADAGPRGGTTGYGLRDWSRLQDWREYEAAIRRQETAFGRPVPLPTEPGAKGQPRLSPRFVEWLMGLPEGHVTDVPGISRNDQLKALGNGVVPQQAAAATRAWLRDPRAEAAA